MSLDLVIKFPVISQNAGLCISRGIGMHPNRVISSHELIFVTEGSLGIREEENRFEIKSGESLILFPNREHSGISPYPLNLRYYWIHFNVLKNFQNNNENNIFLNILQHSTVGRPERLEQLFRWFIDDQESNRLQKPVANMLVVFMLMEVIDSDPVISYIDNQTSFLADRVKQYIKTHFHEHITTQNIAESLGYNSDYLGRVYKKVYKQTITESIHYYRHRFARRLLMNSLANIDEIAQKCGYKSTIYFRQIFKRHEGLPPKAFRKSIAHTHINTE